VSAASPKDEGFSIAAAVFIVQRQSAATCSKSQLENHFERVMIFLPLNQARKIGKKNRYGKMARQEAPKQIDQSKNQAKNKMGSYSSGKDEWNGQAS
jgi:hypothetical protein